MKKLFIIRHAKSSWKDYSLDDFDRPLNKRGKKNAPFMANLLKDEGIIPDIILSSPAIRAKSTAAIYAEQLDAQDKIVFNQNIYEAAVSSLINLLKKVDNSHKTVFLIGHNPSLNALAYEFARFDQNIPTSGIVEIKFDTNNWADIKENNATFLSFKYPKKYIIEE